jgi:hypothetical protein
MTGLVASDQGNHIGTIKSGLTDQWNQSALVDVILGDRASRSLGEGASTDDIIMMRGEEL